MSKDGESLYCSVCGSVQEENNQFCSSCGIDLKLGESKPNFATQEYGSTTQTENRSSTSISTEGGGLVIATYLAFIGCFTGCFIMPVVGLFLVRNAVKDNEDEKNIKNARLVNIASLIITILILIGTILAIVLPIVLWY
ncbi:MAG: hypothetical protein ACTSPT_01955 [Candidatus Heimdallarchaeota archaeon]